MSHRTVDFVGTTHSTRFGRSTSAVQSVPERVSTLGQLDELEAEALPAMHELMNLGASFSVYHGCPMLRAENVPRAPESDALVAKVACEFGSEAMQCVVQNALIRNETDEVDISVLGGDDENDDDGADAALVDSQPVDVVVSVVENTSNVPPSAVSRVSVVSAREWGDAPLCAMTVTHPDVGDQQHPRESPPWESTTAMSVDFLHVSDEQCSFECGKRLNRAVAAMLVHAGFGAHCVSLFTAPEKFIIVGKLRRFNKLYRDLFSTATQWFATTRLDGCFRARFRGIYVFGRSAEVVQQALRVVESVVKQQLAPSIVWRFECERLQEHPLSDADVSVVATSLHALSSVVANSGQRLRAVTLSLGAVQPDPADVLKRLRPAARYIRLLTVLGWENATSDIFEELLDTSPVLVLSWHTPGAMAAKVKLAKKFPSRFCLLSVLDGDAANAKSALRAMNFDDETASALVGTHLSTMPLRASASRKLVMTQ